MPREVTDEEILDSQDQWIRENCGEGAAGSANYGWFVDEIEGEYGTKVYGPKGGVLVTSMETGNHTWHPNSQQEGVL